jgi:hypothetical protein
LYNSTYYSTIEQSDILIYTYIKLLFLFLRSKECGMDILKALKIAIPAIALMSAPVVSAFTPNAPVNPQGNVVLAANNYHGGHQKAPHGGHPGWIKWKGHWIWWDGHHGWHNQWHHGGYYYHGNPGWHHGGGGYHGGGHPSGH